MSHKQGVLAMLYFWLQQILTLYEVQMVVAYHINKSLSEGEDSCRILDCDLMNTTKQREGLPN